MGNGEAKQPGVQADINPQEELPDKAKINSFNNLLAWIKKVHGSIISFEEKSNLKTLSSFYMDSIEKQNTYKCKPTWIECKKVDGNNKLFELSTELAIIDPQDALASSFKPATFAIRVDTGNDLWIYQKMDNPSSTEDRSSIDSTEVQGAVFFRDGSVFRGTIAGSDQLREGTLEFVSGDIYIGHFLNNLPHSRSTVDRFYFRNGIEYEGTVEKGELHGTGTVSINNQTVGECVFSDGIMIGKK